MLNEVATSLPAIVGRLGLKPYPVFLTSTPLPGRLFQWLSLRMRWSDALCFRPGHHEASPPVHENLVPEALGKSG